MVYFFIMLYLIGVKVYGLSHHSRRRKGSKTEKMWSAQNMLLVILSPSPSRLPNDRPVNVYMNKEMPTMLLPPKSCLSTPFSEELTSLLG